MRTVNLLNPARVEISSPSNEWQKVRKLSVGIRAIMPVAATGCKIERPRPYKQAGTGRGETEFPPESTAAAVPAILIGQEVREHQFPQTEWNVASKTGEAPTLEAVTTLNACCPGQRDIDGVAVRRTAALTAVVNATTVSALLHCASPPPSLPSWGTKYSTVASQSATASRRLKITCSTRQPLPRSACVIFWPSSASDV